MVEVLAGKCDDTQNPPPIDMQKLFFAYTMDSISKIFFGRDTNTISEVKDELAESFDNAHRFSMQFIFNNVVVKFSHLFAITATHQRDTRVLALKPIFRHNRILDVPIRAVFCPCFCNVWIYILFMSLVCHFQPLLLSSFLPWPLGSWGKWQGNHEL